MSVADQVNRVKYISEDFATYRQEADSFFQTHYPEEFNNLIATDLGNALMDQLAFAMQSLSFMVNRRASELFLSTARLNKSITKLSRMMGYAIQPAAPSTCDLTIQLTSGPYTFPVIIPVGFQFQGPGDTVYQYYGAVNATIPPGDTTITIPVKEGSSRSATFISDGSENQQFSVFGVPAGQFMYSEDLTLTADGTAWEREDIIGYQSENIFEILFTESPAKLRFGDGIAGNIPPTNSRLILTYRSGKGAAGSIGQNQLKAPTRPLVINGITIPMKLTNTVATVGQDPEDIRHVRAYASSFFRTQNAAVVKTDYDTIAALEPGVALADAQIIRGVGTDTELQTDFECFDTNLSVISGAKLTLLSASVSGTSSLGVSGTSFVGVSGKSLLAVSGQNFLGVSGSASAGTLGVSGISQLYVGGQNSLGVSGVNLLTVSGIGNLGLSGLHQYTSVITSGVNSIDSCASGLYDYLSDILSDTSQSNHIQVVLLSLDSNNRYISPSSTVLKNVKAKLDSLKDAVVTVNVVDGSSKIVPVDITVELGVSQNAVVDDVEQRSLSALTATSYPYGLLVRRSAGQNLYRSEIIDAIRAANQTGDLVFINAKITSPTALLDENGNLFISKQQIVQDENISVTVKKRLLISGDLVNV